MDTLAKFSQISSDDPSYEAAERGRANMIGVFTGLDWHGAIQIHDGPAPSDTVARLQHYFFGGTTFAVAPSEVTGLTPTEAVDKAVDRFYEGLGWAAAIGAVNYEASLHQIAANILVRNRRLAEGVEEARMAEELAESLDMAVTRDLSRYHHIIAALLGHEVDRDPFDLLVETLASTLVTGHRGVALYLVKVAARYFASAGEFDMAALCMLQPDVGFPDTLPDFGITSIPEDAWKWNGSPDRHLRRCREPGVLHRAFLARCASGPDSRHLWERRRKEWTVSDSATAWARTFGEISA